MGDRMTLTGEDVRALFGGRQMRTELDVWVSLNYSELSQEYIERTRGDFDRFCRDRYAEVERK